MHVHHGLSAHADDWVAHCRQICQQWQVPLVVHRVTLARGGTGVEAHARAARYQAFQETLRAGEVLVTAQHRDDQCETLLALKRGSGPTGLSAMAPSSPLPAVDCCALSSMKPGNRCASGRSPTSCRGLKMRVIRTIPMTATSCACG